MFFCFTVFFRQRPVMVLECHMPWCALFFNLEMHVRRPGSAQTIAGNLEPLPRPPSWIRGSGGATPGRARSNDLAEELPPWMAPWLTKISINFINIAHKQINLCATIFNLYPGLRSYWPALRPYWPGNDLTVLTSWRRHWLGVGARTGEDGKEVDIWTPPPLRNPA